MTVENQISPSAVACGACGANSNPDAKFCKGCGQKLYETCVNCAAPVLLTQKFCGSCGADLDKALQKKRDSHDKWMAEAVSAAREYDFDRGISLLSQIAELQDYRFAESAGNAKQAIEKIKGLRRQATKTVNDKLVKAKQALANGKKAEVVRLLQDVPSRMMSDEVKQMLAHVKSSIDEVSALENEIRAAVAKKDWVVAGGLLGQLLDLAPDNQPYRQLAEKVADKLMIIAEESLDQGNYSAATEHLDAVPRISLPESYQQLRDSVDTVHWLSQQFDAEPYVTPVLGRIAVRFAKEASHDPVAAGLVKELAAGLKQSPRPPRTHVPLWKASAESWMGGRCAVLSLPESLDVGGHQPIRSFPGRFNVAIGLALQGLGYARVKEHFGPKRSILKSLGRRKKKECWGIDIGSASIKAVCLQEDEAEKKLVVKDCFVEEFDAPLCRVGAGGSDEDAETIKLAIANFLRAKEVQDTPVWVNVSASKLISRFVRLPPVKDKAALELIDQEINQKIPIEIDELSIVRWMAARNEDDLHGRAAVVTAAKSREIDKRLEVLKAAGLEVAGLQADSLALVNFAAHEFADTLRLHEKDDADSDGTESADENNKKEAGSTDSIEADASKTPAVAIVDCGASSFSLILVSAEAHWCWTIETGGEDLTARLARATKTTHAEAEKLKRNPAALSEPWKQYEPIEQRQDELRVRLELSLTDALKQNPRFDVLQVWCCGGGCLSHGWIRRLLLQKTRA